MCQEAWSAAYCRQTKIEHQKTGDLEVSQLYHLKGGGGYILYWRYVLMATKPPFLSGRCSGLSQILSHLAGGEHLEGGSGLPCWGSLTILPKENSQFMLAICPKSWRGLHCLRAMPHRLGEVVNFSPFTQPATVHWPWSQFFHHPSESNGPTQLSPGSSLL